MPFDLIGYRNKYHSYYGDSPLEDVAKDAFARGYHQGEPDFDTWKQSSGIKPIIQEDIKRRVRRAWCVACGAEGTIHFEEAAAAELDDFFSFVTGLVSTIYCGRSGSSS